MKYFEDTIEIRVLSQNGSRHKNQVLKYFRYKKHVLTSMDIGCSISKPLLYTILLWGAEYQRILYCCPGVKVSRVMIYRTWLATCGPISRIDCPQFFSSFTEPPFMDIRMVHLNWKRGSWIFLIPSSDLFQHTGTL